MSVEMTKPGTIKEKIVYSKGDVWQSTDPKYDCFAFTLGNIHVVKFEYEADIVRAWLNLDKTYIGSEEAACVKEKRANSAWVFVEKHELLPGNGRVQLKTLCNKLGADELPALYYKEETSSNSNSPTTFTYYSKYDGNFVPPQSQDRPIALDLFAGGGGMSIGLKNAGWNVKYKVDKDGACCETLRKNFPKKKILNMDITRFLRDLKSGKLKIDTQKIVLLHGSPPCQGFSAASKC